jgi:hypothetical protein
MYMSPRLSVLLSNGNETEIVTWFQRNITNNQHIILDNALSRLPATFINKIKYSLESEKSIDVLLKYTDINIFNKVDEDTGITTLNYYVLSKNTKIVKYLLDLGVDPENEDSEVNNTYHCYSRKHVYKECKMMFHMFLKKSKYNEDHYKKMYNIYKALSEDNIQNLRANLNENFTGVTEFYCFCLSEDALKTLFEYKVSLKNNRILLSLPEKLIPCILSIGFDYHTIIDYIKKIIKTRPTALEHYTKKMEIIRRELDMYNKKYEDYINTLNLHNTINVRKFLI